MIVVVVVIVASPYKRTQLAQGLTAAAVRQGAFWHLVSIITI